jgi:hypothetical protein
VIWPIFDHFLIFNHFSYCSRVDRFFKKKKQEKKIKREDKNQSNKNDFF